MILNNDRQISKTLESKRRLFLQKDLFELLQWMDEIEFIHTELNTFTIIEKQLIKKNSMSLKIQALRRKNTLIMSALCKYEQLIKNEIEYGKQDYDIKRSKEHEKQRELFLSLLKEFRFLKSEVNTFVCQFHIR
jgi:hypothetical protein